MTLIWLEVDLYSNPEEKTREGQGRKNYGGCVQALFRFGIVQREVCFCFLVFFFSNLCIHACASVHTCAYGYQGRSEVGIIPFGAGLTGVSYLMWDLKPSSLIE